jgi:CspA family cold shock protein
MSTNTDEVKSVSSIRLLGRVKWFNNKAGYGFITVTDGEKSGSDIFAHHSAINVENQQYKYLIQGEYIEFSLDKTTSSKYEFQATNISGIKGGKLMCETRHDFKLARDAYKSDKPEVEADIVPRQQKAPRQQKSRGEGPRESIEQSNVEKKEWTLVSKKAPAKGRPRKASSVTSEVK